MFAVHILDILFKADYRNSHPSLLRFPGGFLYIFHVILVKQAAF